MTKRLGDHTFKRPSAAKKKNGRPWTVVFGQYLGITTQNSAVVAFFGLAGWFLDKRLETEPYLLIVGILTGAVCGFYMMIRSLHALKNDDQN